MLRLTKLASVILKKKFHDKADGDLVLTGQLKPFNSVDTLDVESPELLFCSVKACLGVASHTCDQLNKSGNLCSSMNFCDGHGPDHQLHNSKSAKTILDYEELRHRYNEELFKTAIKRVQDKLETCKVTEMKSKTIRNKAITQISSLIMVKDEVTTQFTSTKVKNKDAIKAKNQAFLKKVEASARLTKNSPSKANDRDIMNSTAHPPFVTLIDYSSDAEIQRNKKAKQDYEASNPDKSLMNIVNNLIEQANHGGRSSKHINFEVYMEEQLNISYYWPTLHRLINLYNLPTDTETRSLLDLGLAGNSNDSNNRRSKFIGKICQLLRKEETVVGEIVTSTRNRKSCY